MLLVSSVAVSGQAPAPPPMKMGLWQSTSTATMSGLTLPPDVVARLQAAGRPIPGSQPHTTVVQSCVTPDSWKKMFTDMQQNKDCVFSNVQQSSSGMTADVTCKGGRGETSGHFEATFVSTEKITGKVHMTITMVSQPNPITADTTFESVYQGSDCKGVAPGEGKVVR